jgi:Flp pilus assembly protein TadB
VLLFLFLWLTNYSYLSGLLQPGVPRVLLGAGITGIVVGYLAMQKIATVEV